MKFPYLNSSVHPVSHKLAQYTCDKKSNLAVSADVTTAKELLALAESVADHIVILKTHIDIITDFTPDLTEKLRALADNAGFLIFEDRKFADIGNTVMHQVRDGVYQISRWADIINAHLLPGKGIIDGLKAGCQGREIGLLLLAQMSSKNNLFSDSYTKETVHTAEINKDFVMGFIAQEKLSHDEDLITMTPGVNMVKKGDDLGQNYHTPQQVIQEKGSDIVIVGRGIYASDDPKSAALSYQQAAWSALEARNA